MASLLISLFISFKSDSESFFEDKYTILFFTGGILMTLSSLVNFADSTSINNISDDKYLTLLGLLNWLPLIIFFRSFQKFLKYLQDRRRCILILISGSIPIIISSLTQILLKWYGPFETFFGLITWFQRPIDGVTGVTGLFSNPNYLGAWLIIIWPFCLAIVVFQKREFLLSLFKISIMLLTSIIIILTASRSAWVCLIISFPIFFGSKIKKWFFYISGFVTFIFINLFIPPLGNGLLEFLKTTIPKGLWINFTSAGFEKLDISRLEIWIKAMNFIQQKPLFGYGSNSFPKLLANDVGIWKGHSHNLPLEIMINYGIPSALLILIPIFFLVLYSYKKVFVFERNINKLNIFDRAWISSSILLIIMHLVDIQYFDARVSIIGWILLSGLKNIITY